MDPILQSMFQATLLPVLRQMSTEDITAIQAYLNEQISEILASRAALTNGENPSA